MSEAEVGTLARELQEAADLLDVLGEEPFRARAYRAAARGLQGAEGDLNALRRGGFAGVPGVGKGLAAALEEAAQTGALPALAELRARLSAGVPGLLRVQGLGPKKVAALLQGGVDSLEALLAAAESGALQDLKGFGAKTAAGLAEAAAFALAAQGELTRERAAAAQAGAMAALAGAGLTAEAAGDLRRGAETVRELRLLVPASADAVTTVLQNLGWPLREEAGALHTAWQGTPLALHPYDSEHAGAALAHATGPAGHWTGLQRAAADQGLTLSPAGLRRGDTRLPTPDEAALHRTLELPHRPPEHREPEHGELDLPPEGELLRREQLRGALHTHSQHSDGTATLREMVSAALAAGYDYLGTGDHSRSSTVANGMSLERLEGYIAEVRALQAEGLPVLLGAEVDILPDGSLDYPDEWLRRLDYVVASVHSHFGLDGAAQTRRLLRAVRHPLVTVLGHPTGRLLTRRPAYPVDLDAVLGACEETGTVAELNANPWRLDLGWRAALPWRGRVKFAVNTDAHSPAGLLQVEHGVTVARKAGLTPENVVNTLGMPEFLALARELRERKAGL